MNKSESGKDLLDEFMKFLSENELEDQFEECVIDMGYFENEEEFKAFPHTLKTIVDYQREDSSVFYVFKIDEHFFQRLGSYCSWSGVEWENGWHEVKPVEVMVTEWHVVC